MKIPIRGIFSLMLCLSVGESCRASVCATLLGNNLPSLRGLNYERVYFESEEKLFEMFYEYPDPINVDGQTFRGNLIVPTPTESATKREYLSIEEIRFMQRAARWASLRDPKTDDIEENSSYDVVDNARKLQAGQLSPNELPKIVVFQDTQGRIWTTNHRILAAFLLSGVVEQVPVTWADADTARRNLNKFFPLEDGRSIDLINRFRGWAIRIRMPSSASATNGKSVILEQLPEKGKTLVAKLRAKHTDLPAWITQSRIVQNAIALSMSALNSVTRKDNTTPYIDHPIRLAIVLNELLPMPYPLRSDVIAGAIMHDYLEEGPGISADSVNVLRSNANDISQVGFLSAIFLTEPSLDYDKFESDFVFAADEEERQTQLEKTGYVLQSRAYLERLVRNGKTDLAQALADVALADKIVNAGDFNYVFQSSVMTTQEKKQKIYLVVGTYSLILNLLSEFASPSLIHTLQQSINLLAEKVGLQQSDITKSHTNAWVALRSIQAQMLPEIESYHRRLGLD
ncbi:MAG: hypothetical protein IPJ71_10130 [Bdellovibrionales bacterium]|nr:hypothetical protein [Bdellovibrionales bacterium]